MVNRMTDIGLLVFRTTLTELGIPGPVWDHATNGAAHGLGTHWFVAHHYRGHREQLGCAPHKDTGFVTVPYTEQPGLEVFRDREWVLIDPVPGYFIVNFGRSFEILTGIYSIGTTAALHRVRRFTTEQSGTDRVSFAAFVDPPASGYLYRVNPEGTASPVIGIEEFLRANNKDTWDDEHTDFGIAPISGNGEPR
jgi:isopenicillin N synthase-like dioxygenase